MIDTSQEQIYLIHTGHLEKTIRTRGPSQKERKTKPDAATLSVNPISSRKSIMELPDEILTIVFRHAKHPSYWSREYAKLTLVCRKWARIVEPLLYEDIRYFKLKPDLADYECLIRALSRRSRALLTRKLYISVDYTFGEAVAMTSHILNLTNQISFLGLHLLVHTTIDFDWNTRFDETAASINVNTIFNAILPLPIVTLELSPHEHELPLESIYSVMGSSNIRQLLVDGNLHDWDNDGDPPDYSLYPPISLSKPAPIESLILMSAPFPPSRCEELL